MTTSVFERVRWFTLSTGVAIAALAALAPSAKAADFSLNFDQSVNGGDLLMNADGTLVTTQWSDWGLNNISGINNRTGQAAKLNTYDTTKEGQDNDLKTGANWGTASQGNVLIIQEENRSNNNYFNSNGVYRADDEARGGNINFDFDGDVAFNSFSLLDIDDNGRSIMVKGVDAQGNSVLDINIDDLIDSLVQTYGTTESDAYGQSVTMDGVTMTQMSHDRGDNSLYTFAFEDTYLSDINFIYPGSGAIAGLEWSTSEVGGPRKVAEPSTLAALMMLSAAAKLLKRKSENGI